MARKLLNIAICLLVAGSATADIPKDPAASALENQLMREWRGMLKSYFQLGLSDIDELELEEKFRIVRNMSPEIAEILFQDLTTLRAYRTGDLAIDVEKRVSLVLSTFVTYTRASAVPTETEVARYFMVERSALLWIVSQINHWLVSGKTHLAVGVLNQLTSSDALKLGILRADDFYSLARVAASPDLAKVLAKTRQGREVLIAIGGSIAMVQESEPARQFEDLNRFVASFEERRESGARDVQARGRKAPTRGRPGSHGPKRGK